MSSGYISDIPRDEAIGTGIFSFMLQRILSYLFPAHPQARVAFLSNSRGFTDPSGPLFSIYLDRAEDHDKKMTDRWKADADGILIFTGLFSAVVATFIGVSIQDLRPNS
ncbi:hypothetical protein BGY98DRAFT_1038276 [Russula aff. rugulosa BPL654]|nr:hypothetical protein BGY98DRAFT_1038276 [Russula aff. rugulosa BPL654]